MNDNDIKKLSRADLLELLILQTEENEKLRASLSECEQKLANRQIILDECGSIAEASLKLSGIFQVAESAASEYVENVKRRMEEQDSQFSLREQAFEEAFAIRCEEQEALFAQRTAEAEEKIARMLNDAEKKRKAIESETEKQCKDMVRIAKKESERYWNRVSEKIDQCLMEYPEIREKFAHSRKFGGDEDE